MEFSDIVFSVRNKWGNQNSLECQGYSDRARIMLKLLTWGTGHWENVKNSTTCKNNEKLVEF